MSFIPHTENDIKKMLDKIGVSRIEELISKAVPEEAVFTGKLNLPEPLSELEADLLLEKLASQNAPSKGFITFLGAGVYNHFIPAVVDSVVSKPEFFTAYTPYQPEVSQGTLAAIFEFQTMIAELTGMDVSNASMYDGATSAAEAVLMAKRLAPVKDGGTIISLEPLHPFYKKTIKTYIEPHQIKMVEVPHSEGIPDFDSFLKALKNYPDAFAVIFSQPTFYGTIYDYRKFVEEAKNFGLITIAIHDPHLLAFLEPPGKLSVDICCGEAQPLGNPLNFGGPLLGYLSTKAEFLRQLPGRLVGETADVNGDRVFVMTLQTREQHIRREKATSNICTNEALCALSAVVYLSWLGKEGFKELSSLIFSKTMFAAEELSKHFTLPFKKPFFKDFVVRLNKDAEEVVRKGLQQKIIAGIPLSKLDETASRNDLMISVTELNTKEEIEALINFLKEV